MKEEKSRIFKYIYFVSYTYDGGVNGNCEFGEDFRIRKISDIENIRKMIEDSGLCRVIINNYILLRENDVIDRT